MRRKGIFRFIVYLPITVCVLIVPGQIRAQSANCESATSDLSGYIAGSYGSPIEVMDDFGCWSVPMKVYTNSEIEVFIPADITLPGWTSWHIAQFLESGVYFTDIYTFVPSSRTTLRQLLVVDTRTGMFKLTDGITYLRVYRLSHASPAQRAVIGKITSIMTKQFAWYRRHNLPTAQALANQQRLEADRMSICSATPNSPECTESNAVLAAKCLACRKPLPSPSATSTRAAQSADTTKGATEASGIRPPVLEYSPAPRYTAAARRAKLKESVMIQCLVGTDGRPHNLKLISKPLGLGLDHEALKAVSEYIFEPALERRTESPVPFKVDVKVTFKIF